MANAINPVQPARVITKRSGGGSRNILTGIGGAIGGVVGGLGGALAGGASAGPAGVAIGAGKGALFGASAGAGLGSTISGFVDPVRTRQVQQGGPQMSGGGLSMSNLSHKYKMSPAGLAALEGYQAIETSPQYAEFKQPLGMAILQDIAQNNRRNA